MAKLAKEICAAYAWRFTLGYETIRASSHTIVRDASYPRLWDANHASGVRVRTLRECAEVVQRVDEALVHSPHRLVHVDPFTPTLFPAYLAMIGYVELEPAIQLVLRGEPENRPCDVTFRPVVSEEDWQSLGRLVRRDHVESSGKGRGIPQEVSDGVLERYRRQAPAGRFFLASVNGEDVAFGGGVICENGVGIVEAVYTEPRYRRRGIASAMIGKIVEYLRDGNRKRVVAIQAHASGDAKNLYRSLKFEPVCVTRRYHKDAG